MFALMDPDVWYLKVKRGSQWCCARGYRERVHDSALLFVSIHSEQSKAAHLHKTPPNISRDPSNAKLLIKTKLMIVQMFVLYFTECSGLGGFLYSFRVSEYV